MSVDKVTRLSVSQIDSWQQCPMKWYGNYRLKVKRPKKLSLFIGGIFDDSISQDYSVKLFSGEHLPTKEVQEIFISKMEAEVQTIEVWDDKNIKNQSELKDRGSEWVEVFHQGVCQLINPLEVQPYLKMSFKDSPIEVYGKPDVIEVSETIRDTKTSKRKWNPSKAQQSLQPLAYSLFKDGIGKGIIREFWYDIMVKTKTPTYQQIQVIVNDQKRKNFLIYMNYISKQINFALETSSFPPLAYYRNDNLCSRKYCDVWQECEKRWDIKIKEYKENPE